MDVLCQLWLKLPCCSCAEDKNWEKFMTTTEKLLIMHQCNNDKSLYHKISCLNAETPGRWVIQFWKMASTLTITCTQFVCFMPIVRNRIEEIMHFHFYHNCTP